MPCYTLTEAVRGFFFPYGKLYNCPHLMIIYGFYFCLINRCTLQGK